MGKWRKIDRNCPACGNASLEETMFSWHGRTPDGCPIGGIKFPVRCTNCGSKFVRFNSEELHTPEEAGAREQERLERVKALWKAHHTVPDAESSQ